MKNDKNDEKWVTPIFIIELRKERVMYNRHYRHDKYCHNRFKSPLLYKCAQVHVRKNATGSYGSKIYINGQILSNTTQ